jgi:hypothetical protein
MIKVSEPGCGLAGQLLIRQWKIASAQAPHSDHSWGDPYLRIHTSGFRTMAPCSDPKCQIFLILLGNGLVIEHIFE